MPDDPKVCPKCGTRYDPAAVFCQLDGERLGFPDQPVDPFVGRELLGQFRIEEVLGAGGMGTVYRARQTAIDRDVAIKILHPELTQNPDAVRRFQREAKVASKLDHPNVVKVYLFGQLPEDNSLYIVMPYLKGLSLQDVLVNRGALPVQRALHIATQICDGVAEAHRHFVVHRDIKPENVILVERAGDPDFVKVLDFGIARFSSGEQTVATQTGLIFGTARYISPEGALGEPTDARSDVYSIAVLTYQLLCGRTPFDGSSPVALLMKHINETPADVRSQPFGKDVPPHVADVVMRALAKSPDARPEDASRLGLMLREAAMADGVDLPVPRLSGASTVPPIRATSTPTIRGAPVVLPRIGESTGPTGPMGPSPTLEAAPSPFDPSGNVSVAGLRRRRRLGPVATVLIAFLAGAAVVSAGAWSLSLIGPGSVDVEGLEARARAALGRGDLDSPPGENVADLTARILDASPQHEAAEALREEAARRLRDEARAVASQGFLDEARSRIERAQRLAPNDRFTGRMLARLESIESGPPRQTETTTGLRVVPTDVAVGEVAMLVADLEEPAGAGAAPFFYLEAAGRGGLRVPAQPDEGRVRWMASHTFRRAGDYVVAFHEGGDEARFRTALVVGPRRVVRQSEDPVTTQQGSARGTRPQPAVSSPSDGIDWRLPGESTPESPPPIQSTPVDPPTMGGQTPESPVDDPSPPAPWTSGMVI
jgi:serine/threonine-protein kinase